MISLRRLANCAARRALLLVNGAGGRGKEGGENHAKEAEQLIAQEIAKLELFGGAGERAVPLERNQSSILHWANPTPGTFHRNVFAWTKDGRAEAVDTVSHE
ncbi:MAG TPA: hypothetical protein VHC19_21085 [Pirellulales bacterium]|nr:hypothetical protein [Pirellulales bacterium]